MRKGGIELTQTRAIDPLVRHELGVTDRTSAIAHAKQIVASLKGTDFSHTVQAMQSISDVYGVQISGRDWWIKLTLQEVEVKATDKTKGKRPTHKQVLVVSFHPPEREFKTVGGLELKPW
ncbi:MAG: hypothetical protein A2289_23020 [Deltaproteobacteria bacterium RIFOXYA12_FULL_58_15]|nr:MAG: hypothetical protein A2289_23020 [Deltaproteobacteria bacterium RIFOXYA12_FULL_58_15]OGR08684.1 MAG: hypothetical protein A2341_00610 [Deltaproteobacteria bacterium RIFOXYB12_FULL_58_9]